MLTRRSLVSLALVAILGVSTGCDSRAAVGQDSAVGDGPVQQPDIGIATSDGPPLESDVGGPTPGSVLVQVDRLQARPQEQVKGTVFNGTPQTVWLGGCGVLSRQEMVSGAWVDRGGEVICGWEGAASPLGAGASLGESARFPRVGSWRLALRYGLGCDDKKPLNAENCTSLLEVFSQPVEVRATKADCLALDKQFLAALDDAKSCSSDATVPQCTELVTGGLACGCPVYVNDTSKLEPLADTFAAWKCSKLLPPCGVKCASPIPAACLQDRCSPMGD